MRKILGKIVPILLAASLLVLVPVSTIAIDTEHRDLLQDIDDNTDTIEALLTTMDADTSNLDISLTTLRDATKTTTPLGWSYSGEKGVATTVIKASAGMLHGILIETDGTNAVTFQLYDHASTATNPIIPAIVVAGGDLYGGLLGIDAICSNGIVLVLSGTNGVATVLYK